MAKRATIYTMRFVLFGTILFGAAIAWPNDANRASAVYETGTYALGSPRSATAWVTSPTRFHNSCSVTEDWDSPDFDNGTCVKASGPSGDWSMDIGGSSGDPVWIDIRPLAMDGSAAGGTYRVIAGPLGDWASGCPNGDYQTFYVQTKNALNQWETYAHITLGHLGSLYYAEDDVVIAERTSSDAEIIGTIGSTATGCWGTHVHMQVYNSAWYSRTYNWDGPSNAFDDGDYDIGPSCNRSGTSDSQCNTQMFGTDLLGYVGGDYAPSPWTHMANPYFDEF